MIYLVHFVITCIQRHPDMFLKNNNCCFVDQGGFYQHINIFTETRVDLFTKYYLRGSFWVDIRCREGMFCIKNSVLKSAEEFEREVYIGCLLLENRYFEVDKRV